MVFEDLEKEKLIGFLKQAEISMHKKFCKYLNLLLIILELPDTRCVLIANHSLDQFTHYNMPSCYKKASAEQLKWLR